MHYRDEFDTNGFILLPGAIGPDLVSSLARAARDRLGRGSHYGVRNLLDKIPEVRELSRATALSDIAHRILERPALPVRGIFFDKNPDANWFVAWHQDLTIAVRQRVDLPGYGAWSVKEGVVHVQPPTEILRGMVTLRVHLDHTDETNGALWVVPGSHQQGRIDAAGIRKLVSSLGAVPCRANPGDVLAMSPLVLHCSRKATSQRHRRVIHIEYAAARLHPGLEWSEGDVR